MMRAADYLFPRDLEVSKINLSKIIVIGSCFSELYAAEFKKINPALEIENIIFSNALRLPEKTLEELNAFDLQYIQIPLRNVLTDGIIRAPENNSNNDWIEIGKANIDFLIRYGLSYCNVSPILTLVSNFIVPQGKLSPSLSDTDSELDFTRIIRELNYYLSKVVRSYSNVYIADVDMIANTLGKKYFLDDTVYFFTHGVATSLCHFIDLEVENSGGAPSRLEGALQHISHYESKVDEYYAAAFRQIEVIYRIVNQIDQIKLVIFDLDNTMWRGLIGEHYEPGADWPQIHGWPTGVWDAINQLRRRGIVVSLCSKNDEKLVFKNWQNAMPLSFVKLNDFLSPKINWNNKSDNISAIMGDLSLTAKNVLFVDDNPIERESVKSFHPEIRVIGADPFSIKRILTWAPETQVARLSVESAQREISLRGKIRREEARVAMSREEFLRNLDTSIEIVEIKNGNSSQFFRIRELVNKTNQFNTTAVFRNAENYQSHWAKGGRIFAFSVKDRYSDYGLVGVLFSLANCIVQFVMSCRVLGMEIEIAVLHEISVLLENFNPNQIVSGLIIKTEKNTPSQDVFVQAGFYSTENPQLFIKRSGRDITKGRNVNIIWS